MEGKIFHRSCEFFLSSMVSHGLNRGGGAGKGKSGGETESGGGRGEAEGKVGQVGGGIKQACRTCAKPSHGGSTFGTNFGTCFWYYLYCLSSFFLV